MNSKSYIEHEKKIMDMEYDIITEYIASIMQTQM